MKPCIGRSAHHPPARFAARAALPLALLLLAGCGTSTQGPGGSVKPASIALVPAAATLEVGETLTVTASITAADGTALAGLSPAWSTSNSTVATVDQAGKVTALAVGEVDIAAAVQGVSASAHLKVVAVPPAMTALSVSVTGGGTVTGPGGFTCASGVCEASFPKGATIALEATPGSGSVFSAWGGACSGAGACSVVLSSAQSVSAAFVATRLVTLAVTGAGTVTSTPAGLSCGASAGVCSARFPSGAALTLSASAASGSLFTGFGGGASGCGKAPVCDLTLSADLSATAAFAASLTLTVTVHGAGAVTSEPAGISCAEGGAGCSAPFPAGQVVLTGTPAAGAALSAWSGACASASSTQCTLNLSGAASAGATFAASTTLTAASGDGQSAPIDAALPSPIVIHLASGGANAAGVAVSLTGPAGAAITPASASTDSQGNASFHVRLARTVGTQTFTAKAQTAAALAISATATAPAPGTIFTIVNASHNQGFDGFPGAATTAHLKTPSGLALASDGTLYIADYDGNAIFALSPAGLLTVVAGTGACGNSGDGGPALAAQFCQVLDLALDETHGRRTLYLADPHSNLVRAIDLTLPAPQISTFAGGGSPPGPGFGDGAPASQASLSGIGHLSLGPDGYLYLGDSGRNRIRRVSLATQIIENWISGDSSFCRFNACGVSWDAGGRAYVTRNLGLYNFDVFRVDTVPAFTTIAGGANSATADGIYPTQARLTAPMPVRFDGAGNLFLTEEGSFSAGGHDVRRIDLATGKLTTIIGNGSAGYLGDYVPATQALLNTPWTSVLDASGNLYVSDSGNAAVRVVWGAGQATPVRSSIAKTGGDLQSVGVDQITPAMQVTLLDPGGQPLAGYPVQWRSIDPGGVMNAGLVTTDPAGLASADGRVGLDQGGTWRYTASAFDFHGDPLAGSPITFQDTSADLPANYLFTAVNTSHTIGYSGIPGPATVAQIPPATALAYAADGTLYLGASDGNGNAIFTLSPAGVLTPITGSGPCAYSGDDGPALSARLCSLTELALDETHGRRTLYLNDTQNFVVRAIDLLATPPTIHRVAGGGSAGATPYGDGALATEATLSDPEHITVDPLGHYLYVSEYGTGRSRIRRIDLSSGIIKAWLTLDDAFCGVSGCKVAFSAPDQTHPGGMAFFTRSYGSYFCALLRADDPEQPGTNYAVAGNARDRFLYTPDGPALGQYFFPGYFFIGPDGRLYLSDTFTHRVRVMSDLTASATMTTLAGISAAGNGADGPVGTSVALNTPRSLAVSLNGSLLIADSANSAVRVIWKLIH